MDKVPVVSICMITYNSEKFIEEAINGVIMQNADFLYQLVIGEDFSTDNTWQICKRYAENFPEKIKLLPQPDKNLGLMPNFLRTLDACNGKYVALCAGDDYWSDPLKLKKQVDFLEINPEYSACATAHQVYYEESKKFGKVYNKNFDKFDWETIQIIKKNRFGALTLLYRNSIKFPIWGMQLPFEDWSLLLELRKVGPIKILNFITSVYRNHKNGINSMIDITERYKNYIIFYKVFKIEFPEFKLTTNHYLIKAYYELFNLSDGKDEKRKIITNMFKDCGVYSFINLRFYKSILKVLMK